MFLFNQNKKLAIYKAIQTVKHFFLNLKNICECNRQN